MKNWGNMVCLFLGHNLMIEPSLGIRWFFEDSCYFPGYINIYYTFALDGTINSFRLTLSDSKRNAVPQSNQTINWNNLLLFTQASSTGHACNFSIDSHMSYIWRCLPGITYSNTLVSVKTMPAALGPHIFDTQFGVKRDPKAVCS